jgi:hypothetical protein
VRCRASLLWLLLAWRAGEVTLVGAETPAAGTATVALPPMLVEESTSSVPWLYVNAGGTEFLSRCSPSTTRHLAEAWTAKLQLVRALVPEEFLARMDVPGVFVLYSQDLDQTMSAEIQRELQARGGRSGDGTSPRGGGVNIAPSMRLSDRDMHASIAYIDEALFDAAGLSVSSGHVRFLLEGRVPGLPAWVIEGVERTYRRADLVLEPITLGPMAWGNSGESGALARDPNRPRALLPATELFAPEPARAGGPSSARRAEVRSATQELFFRWAVVSGEAMRAAYWQLATRAAEGPVTEEVFEACFGFGFSELRYRLSDYLPEAVDETAWIAPGKLPPRPRLEVERATPNQVARIRGEWERLAIGHVQRRLPQVREPYVAQARRTLRRAYDAGDRDPRLLAILGLCEIDAGSEERAREFLEPAVAAGVVRPRAHYELARLRWAELTRGGQESRLFSFTELAPVIEPLRRAVKQSPPLPEVFALLAEAWSRCEFTPTASEFAELERGAQLFVRRPAVGFAVAQALARHGRKGEASALLQVAASYATDDGTRGAVARLRTELAAESTPVAADPAPEVRR